MAREKDEKQALEQILKGDVESGMKINIHHTADALKSSQYEMNALQVVSLPNTSIHHTFGDQFFIFTFLDKVAFIKYDEKVFDTFDRNEKDEINIPVRHLATLF